MSLFRCVVNSEGDTVHYLFADTYCYSGEHLVLMILVGFTSIILILISMITGYLNFENSMITDDVTASKNGHHNFYQICYFTIITMIFAFFSTDEYTFFRMACLLVGSFVLFMSFHYYAPFYSYSMQRFYSCLISVVFWSSIMLIFAYFMENTMFHGILFGYICLLPLLLLIVLNNRYHGLDVLTLDYTDISDGAKIGEQFAKILMLDNW